METMLKMKEIQKAVIIKDDKYLVLLRAKTAKFFPLHWDFPGGKLEPNEKPEDGIIREIKEETNLDIEPIQVEGIYEFVIKNIPHRFTLYSTKLLSNDVKISHEHLDFKWLTKEEILKLKTEPYIEQYFK